MTVEIRRAELIRAARDVRERAQAVCESAIIMRETAITVIRQARQIREALSSLPSCEPLHDAWHEDGDHSE